MKCEIIRDLLPSYIDGLTSEESNQEIEKHLEGCAECRDYLETMQKEMVSQACDQKSKEELAEEIKPFKKIRKMTGRAILNTVIICAIVFSLIYDGINTYYSSGWTANSEDIEITYEKVDGTVVMGFHPKKDDVYLSVGVTGDSTADSYERTVLTVVEYRIKPWEEKFVRSGYWDWKFIDENTIADGYPVGDIMVYPESSRVTLTGEEVVQVEFADVTKEVKLKDLYTEAGVEGLK